MKFPAWFLHMIIKASPPKTYVVQEQSIHIDYPRNVYKLLLYTQKEKIFSVCNFYSNASALKAYIDGGRIQAAKILNLVLSFAQFLKCKHT